MVSVVKEKLSTPTVKNLGDTNMSDQNDEDEGEILSDEEAMETEGTTSRGDTGPSVGYDNVLINAHLLIVLVCCVVLTKWWGWCVS